MLLEEHVYWYGHVEACSSSLLRRWLNFSTAWCTTRLNGAEKDWNHVLMQKVVTLNICWGIACLTCQLSHITTGSFQSHRRQPTTSSLQSLQHLKECNKPSVRWKSFAIHKLVRWYFQVGWASGLQIVFVWDNVNNQKYVWIILLKMTSFRFPKVQWLHLTGEVDNLKIFVSNFLRISRTKRKSLNRLIFDRVIKKIKGGRFWNAVQTVYTAWSNNRRSRQCCYTFRC